MDDVPAEGRPAEPESPGTQANPRTAWERALNGPPINPRSELIYHDRKALRSRHSR